MMGRNKLEEQKLQREISQRGRKRAGRLRIQEL